MFIEFIIKQNDWDPCLNQILILLCHFSLRIELISFTSNQKYFPKIINEMNLNLFFI